MVFCFNFVSDIAIFVLKRDVKLQLTNFCFNFCRPLHVSTNLRRFPNQEDLSPTADLQQPDWGRDLKPGHNYPPVSARMADYEFGRDQSYPDAVADPGYPQVQSGYIVEGYPEGVVMRNKPDNRAYYPYHPQRNGFESHPEHDSTRRPGEYVHGGQSPTRGMANPASSGVSGNPQDLYAKVVKPSERDQNMMVRQPHDVDPSRPGFERGPDGSVSSGASFALRPDGGRLEERWRPSPSPADASVMRQRNLQPARDHNYNVNKPPGSDGPSRMASQPRAYHPGQRHIDGTPMFGDPSKDSSRQPVASSNARPNHLPLPASMRGQYIDELAAAKTPHTQQDLLQAKALSQQRHGQPPYFQYPGSDTPPKVSFQ